MFVEDRGLSIRVHRQSPGGTFSLGWNRQEGRVVLIQGTTVVTRVRAVEPNKGAVADNGVFAIGEIRQLERLASAVSVWLPDGQLLFRHTWSALPLNIALSRGGECLVAQLCNSDTEDGGTLQCFHVAQRCRLWSEQPETGWPDDYEFDLAGGQLGLVYSRPSRRCYRYSLADGSFLDGARWETERYESMSAYEILRVLKERYARLDRPPSSGELEDANRLATMALERGLLGSPKDASTCYSVLGDLFSAVATVDRAIWCFEQALTLNPKARVKKKLEALRRAPKP